MPINENYSISILRCIYNCIGVCSYYFHSSNDTNRCCRKKVILKIYNNRRIL